MLETSFFPELKTKLLKQSLDIIALNQSMLKTFFKDQDLTLFLPPRRGVVQK